MPSTERRKCIFPSRRRECSRVKSHKSPTAAMAQPVGMPMIGLGCWKAEKGVTEEVVYNAIKAIR